MKGCLLVLLHPFQQTFSMTAKMVQMMDVCSNSYFSLSRGSYCLSDVDGQPSNVWLFGVECGVWRGRRHILRRYAKRSVVTVVTPNVAQRFCTVERIFSLRLAGCCLFRLFIPQIWLTFFFLHQLQLLPLFRLSRKQLIVQTKGKEIVISQLNPYTKDAT